MNTCNGCNCNDDSTSSSNGCNNNNDNTSSNDHSRRRLGRRCCCGTFSNEIQIAGFLIVIFIIFYFHHQAMNGREAMKEVPSDGSEFESVLREKDESCVELGLRSTIKYFGVNNQQQLNNAKIFKDELR